MNQVIIIPNNYFSNLKKISKYIPVDDIEKALKEILNSKYSPSLKVQLYIQVFERYLRRNARKFHKSTQTDPIKKPESTVGSQTDKPKTSSTIETQTDEIEPADDDDIFEGDDSEQVTPRVDNRSADSDPLPSTPPTTNSPRPQVESPRGAVGLERSNLLETPKSTRSPSRRDRDLRSITASEQERRWVENPKNKFTNRKTPKKKKKSPGKRKRASPVENSAPKRNRM
jgi:hypothetical protein